MTENAVDHRHTNRIDRRRVLQGAVAAGAGAAAWTAPNVSTFGFAPAYAAVTSGCDTITRAFQFGLNGSGNPTAVCTGTCGDVNVSGSGNEVLTITMPEPDDGTPGTVTIVVQEATPGDAELAVFGIGAGNACSVIATNLVTLESVTIVGETSGILLSALSITPSDVTIAISCGPFCP